MANGKCEMLNGRATNPEPLIPNPGSPDLLAWHLEHDGVAARRRDTLASYERDQDAWNAAFESGREAERRDICWARQKNAWFWMFIGAVALVSTTVLAAAIVQCVQNLFQ